MDNGVPHKQWNTRELQGFADVAEKAEALIAAIKLLPPHGPGDHPARGNTEYIRELNFAVAAAEESMLWVGRWLSSGDWFMGLPRHTDQERD